MGFLTTWARRKILPKGKVAEMPKIKKYAPAHVRIIAQGDFVAGSLQDYFSRHPEMEQACSKRGTVRYLTTENPNKFRESAQLFLHEHVEVETTTLGT